MSDYFVLASPGEGEFTDRKSRFIGHAMPISGEAEAAVLIDQIKRKYWDARHNCYAFVTGENGEISRSSDDGEPSGTAGRPILDCITGAELRGVLIVVTRYFGGTLLGTGGLVRAYTQAAKEALAHADIRHMQAGSRIEINVDYNSAEKLRRSLETDGVRIEDTAYTDSVKLTVIVSAPLLEQMLDIVTQVSSGRAEVRVLEQGYYAL